MIEEVCTIPRPGRGGSPVIVFSLCGYLIATYLTFYQAGLISSVWEPFFGNGSRMILKESAIARYCPIPDASLGAFLYLLDVFLNCLGEEDRWRTAPWTVLAVGCVSSAACLWRRAVGDQPASCFPSLLYPLLGRDDLLASGCRFRGKGSADSPASRPLETSPSLLNGFPTQLDLPSSTTTLIVRPDGIILARTSCRLP